MTKPRPASTALKPADAVKAAPSPLSREIESAVADLERLGEQSELLGPQLVAHVHKTCRDAHQRHTRESVCAVVIGDAPARAAFLDEVLGRGLFGGAKAGAQSGPLTFLRHRQWPGYKAIIDKGQVVEFQAPELAVVEALAAELARAAPNLPLLADAGEEEPGDEMKARSLAGLSQAAAEVAQAQSDLATRQQATDALGARVPRFLAVRPPGWAVWLWLLRLLLGPFYRRATAGLAEERHRLEQARARVDAARAGEERASLEDRRVRFRLATRALESRFAREVLALRSSGDQTRQLRELHIEFPARRLPPGVTLIDAPAAVSVDGDARRRARQVVLEADGVIVVHDQARGVPPLTQELLQELGSRFPRVPPGAVVAGEPFAWVELLRGERDATAAARVASAAQACARGITAAEARAVMQGRERLARLEGLRLAQVEEFKARQLQKVREPAADGARAVVEAARQALHGAVERVAETWLAQVQACESKEKLKALVGELGKRVEDKAMVAAALRLVDGVVWEQTAVTVERLQRLLAAELVERCAVAEKVVGAPPVDEGGLLPGAEPTERVPSGVRDAILFSDSGEAAAAAASAVFIGVLGGLFKGLDALKQECAEQVYNGAAELERRLSEELASSAPTIALGVESALAARLGTLLATFEQSLVRYRKIAQDISTAERERLAPLHALGTALAGHHERLEALLAPPAAVPR